MCPYRKDLVCLFLSSTSSPSTSTHHFLSYNAASCIRICSLSIQFSIQPSTEGPEPRRDQMTPAMWDLHWLPIIYRIRYKLCILMHAVANNNSLEYIIKILVRNSSLQERVVSFTSGGYVVPRSKTEFGKRAFCVAGPTAWNELPPELRNMPDIQTFKRTLKTHLFNAAYDN